MVKNSFDPSLYFGHIIVTKTCDGHTFEGELYCYDVCSNFIILKEDNKNGTANFYILRTNIIVDIETKRKIKNSYDPLPVIDKSVVEKIERKAIANFEKNRSRIGIGVTQEAQELFDFIWKTHPDCTWNNQDILVLNGEVMIKPPYGPDNCIANNENLKERFATVISKFRQKKKSMSIKGKSNSELFADNRN
ncbi:lsm12, putative [Plasmodium ovale]|uniref:Lsm12, putative n=2 Tax=Plasmodium ovale TaxID=36330 RepID=A0A1A8WSG4_PLAOA|nr:lsm12, putative [Plasmodium ovale curtisi]SBS95253.1 lsm12, putative [Plasmodium ovale curtisi]SCP05145.1 lsm12, putative [Plasmodium ovale]